jgi:hypothetical protein
MALFDRAMMKTVDIERAGMVMCFGAALGAVPRVHVDATIFIIMRGPR